MKTAYIKQRIISGILVFAILFLNIGAVPALRFSSHMARAAGEHSAGNFEESAVEFASGAEEHVVGSEKTAVELVAENKESALESAQEHSAGVFEEPVADTLDEHSAGSFEEHSAENKESAVEPAAGGEESVARAEGEEHSADPVKIYSNEIDSVAHAAGPILPANSPNLNLAMNDLVVLVVEKNLYNDNTSYPGLSNAYNRQFANLLRANRMRDRVYRYADHIVNNNPMTDVKVVVFDKSRDDVLSLSSALENFYRNGDGSGRNKLRGVVLIGEVPLPVVSKNGNRFISIFPYVDFSDKAYIYNPDTNSFERNNNVTFPKADIWHGIIRQPEEDPNGTAKLAEFFDKNHLHYEDVPLFADFDRKLFFGDLVHKADRMNSDLYARYVKYLESLEDLAYFRFNKEWAARLTGEIMGDLDDFFSSDESNLPPEFAESFQSDDFMDAMPDIMTQQIVLQNLMEYHQLFAGYFSRLNDFIDYTARYTVSDVHSVPQLIGTKDKYTQAYIRNVNDAIENSINNVVSMIEEPLPLVEYTTLEGEFWSRAPDGRITSVLPFRIGSVGQTVTTRYNFHYVPTIPGREEIMYINGIQADIMESAKQCAPYLGSVNQDPEKYSALTRSIRSDNFITAMPLVTSGVNTRIISPLELHALTGYAGNISPQGVKETGAIIEPLPEYGIPSFIHNPLHSSYIGPFERELREGDVIVSVNGKNLSYAHTFDLAIQESYDAVMSVIDIYNDDDLSVAEKASRLNNLSHPVKSLEILPGQTLGAGRIERAVGYIGVEYYRDGDKNKKFFSFTVDKDGKLSKGSPYDSARVFVVMARPPMAVAMFANPAFFGMLYLDDSPRPLGEPNKGSLFTLYENDDSGYSNRAYDASAGCNFASTIENSDRCFPTVATIPVLDPAGSVVPEFPHRSEVPEENSVELFNFPEGIPYDHVDLVYYNSCYSGLPSVEEANLQNNNYDFVLDPSTRGIFEQEGSPLDLYGTLLKGFGDFVRGGRADRPDYPENYNPKEQLWSNLDEIDASQVILNEDPLVTLKDFSDRYGLFDGEDNTGNDISDFEWRQNDEGVYTTKFYDFAEASEEFGIPSTYIDEIARKMLAHESVYVVPYGFASFRNMHGDKFDRDIVLKVTPHYYKDKTVSSMIIHNEPTPHTLSQQFSAGTTPNLPIDNPRYVYFQSKPEPRENPSPFNPLNPREAENHYSPGKGHRIEYINLFDTDTIPTFDNLKIELDKKAAELALVPGSYRVFGPNARPEDYTLLQIKNDIYNNHLLPAVTGKKDNPPSGFNLTTASEMKIYDSLKWLNLNIDEKTEYIFTHYLNAEKDPYVAKTSGYEAAYLVLDGERDFFEFSFNLDLPEEDDPFFDPFREFEDDGDDEDDDAVWTPRDGSTTGEIGNESVSIVDFFKELRDFLTNFSMYSSKSQDVCLVPRPDDPESDKLFEDEEEDEPEEEEEAPSEVFTGENGEVRFSTYVYEDVEGMDELLTAIRAQEDAPDEPVDPVDPVEPVEPPVEPVEPVDPPVEPVEPVDPLDVDEDEEPAPDVDEDEDPAPDVDEDDEPAPDVDEETVDPEYSMAITDFIKRMQVEEERRREEEREEISPTPPVPPTPAVPSPTEEESPIPPPDTEPALPEDVSAPDVPEPDIPAPEDVPAPVPPPEDEDWASYFIRVRYYQKFLSFNDFAGRNLYASLNIFPEGKTEEHYVVNAGNSFVADGKSFMRVDVQVLDRNGDLAVNLNRNVRFSVDQDMVEFENGNVVRLNDGSASIHLSSGTKTGVVNLKAEVLRRDGTTVDTTYSPIEKEIFLEAGPTASLNINADSNVLVANGISSSKVTVSFKDRFGNLADNDFSMVTVFADGDIRINQNSFHTFDGKAEFNVFAGNSTGEGKIIAVLTDYELEELMLEKDLAEIDFSKYVGAVSSFDLVDKVEIEGFVLDGNFEETDSVPADGNSVARIGVRLLHNGRVLSKYSGPVNFRLPNQSYGTFISPPPKNMSNGLLNPANLTFKTSTVAGDAEILVDVPGFASDTIKFKTAHGEPAQMVFGGDKNEIYVDLLDKNGNLITDDSGIRVTFKATEATSGLINIDSPVVVSAGGRASTGISATGVSGKVNIIAEAEGIKPATLSMEFTKRLKSEDVAQFSPRSLYVSLLGGAYGNVRDRENLAQTILYSGQVQALSAITASPSDNKRIFGVDAYGHVDILDGLVQTDVIPATDSFPYQKIVFSDVLSNTALAEIFVVPKNNTPVVLLEEEEDFGEEGIFVENLIPENPSLQFEESEGGVRIKSGGELAGRIDRFGRISLNDDSFRLVSPEFEDLLNGNFVLIIERRNIPVISVTFKQNFNKNVIPLSHDSAMANFAPGIYVKMRSSSPKYELVPSLSGISSDNPTGLYLVNTQEPISPSQAPGFSFSSLEDGKDTFGLGFDGDNKHMLLFSAGNSVGEAHLPYPSESGLIFGDPLIRLNVDDDLISKATGYSKDLGKPIFTGDESIDFLIDMDFNGTGHDDLLLGYENGLVRLLENVSSPARFIDRGYVLHVNDGITSMTRIDINNNGYDDLIIGTKEACTVGEDCVSLFMNNNGHFVRTPLPLSLGDKKITKLMSADMDADGCEDLVLSDSSGNVSVYYNSKDGRSCTGLSKTPGNTWSFGFTLDPDVDLFANLFVHYPGMESQTSNNSHKFVSFDLESDQPGIESHAGTADDVRALRESILTSPDVASANVPPLTFTDTFDFIHVPQDGRLLTSSKMARDINGGTVQVGDNIEFIITLRNSGASPINGLILSDVTPVSMELAEDSLSCMDIGCPDDLKWETTGLRSRSHVIRNISVPANGSRRIRYVMTVKTTADVDFDIGKDFVDYPEPTNNPYMDIEIRPRINPDGILTYMYATGPRTYRRYDLDTKLLDDGSDERLSDIVPEDPKTLLNQRNQDSNYSGYPDALGGGGGQGDSLDTMITNAVENALIGLRCSGGGCFPIPYNKAFLVPDGTTPGISVLAIGTPNPPYFGFFVPSTITSSFRIYVSPTLTGGLGTAVCAGPSTGHSSPCFAFAVPGGIPGVCGALDTTLDRAGDAISKAKVGSKGSSVNADTGMTTIISDGEGTQSRTSDISMGGNWSDPDSPFSVGSEVNVKIPGFPSVIVNWMDNQTDEIFNKLLSLPTFYLILPGMGELRESLKQREENLAALRAGREDDGLTASVWHGFKDLLFNISNLPFVQIEGREVVWKIPAVSKYELDRVKREWSRLYESLEYQLEARIKIWGCDKDAETRKVCDMIILDIKNFLVSINQLLELLDQLGNLPREILSWRHAQAKYATQIICYMDAIMNFIGGWLKRQQKIALSWVAASQDVIRTFKSWQLILDIFAEYQKSCDQCKNDRFSKLGLLLNFFAVLPEPPVIPMPKLPDIFVDVSQIRLGTRIIWPDVIFRPERVRIPSPPDIRLPDVLPSITAGVDLPTLDLRFLKDYDFSLFLSPDFPDLPPLPLPTIPDLPRPPKIPRLPDVVGDLSLKLRNIFKILCLLKNGLVPVPEWGLATEIETLTQPNIQAVLPIIKNLGVEMPGIQYDFVKEVHVKAEMNFHLDTNFIYQTVRHGTRIWNEKLGVLHSNLRNYANVPSRVIENFFISLEKVAQEAIEDALREAEEAAQSAIDETTQRVEERADDATDLETKINSEMAGINEILEDFIASLDDYQNYPNEHHIVASQTLLTPDHPSLNRSIADIKLDIGGEDWTDVPGISELAEVRNSLIGFVDGIHESNKVLEQIEDLEEFGSVLAQFDSKKHKVASLTSDVDFSGDGREEKSVISRQIAGNFEFDFEEYVQAGGESDQAPPIGLYIASSDGKVNENVLMYTPALRLENHVIYSDVNNNGDLDMIFSSGGEIYLKENRLNPENLPKGRLTRVLGTNTVSNYVNSGGTSVQGLQVNEINHRTANLSWMPSPSASYYKLILRNSVMHREEDNAYEFMLDGDNARTSLEIDNGYYAATIYSIDEDGNVSLQSDSIAVSPQLCADKDPPFPAVSVSSFTVPIFQTVTIDAGNSFDADGEIVEYFLETKPYSNEDLVVTELPRFIRNADNKNPVFEIGPFTNEGDIGRREFVLHVVDQSGNRGSMNLSVDVTNLNISLDETFARNFIASGEVTPTTANVPFSLMRFRYIYRVLERELKLVRQLDRMRDSFTDFRGTYRIDDFKTENMVVIENSRGEPIAEVHPKTGNIKILAEGYFAVVRSASPPSSPTRVDIVDVHNVIFGTVHVISNSNIDVKINEPVSRGVTALAESPFEFLSRPANDPKHPGGAVLINRETKEILAIVDTSGNIIVLRDGVSLALKDNDHKVDPLTIEIIFRGSVAGEVVIIPTGREALIVGPDDVPFLSPRTPTFGTMNPVGSMDWLFRRGAGTDLRMIMEELYKDEPDIFIGPNDLVKRGEFVRVLLNMLCIIPRPEAYEDATSREHYWDAEELGPHFAHINESTFRGLVHGYLGELDDAGRSPFKADNTITRAEATKIIVNALAMKEIIDLSDFDEFNLKDGEPWYNPFMSVAQDITPYVNPDYFTRKNFVVTPEEALDPNKEMTFEELVIMVERVLEIYNCIEAGEGWFGDPSDYDDRDFLEDDLTGIEDSPDFDLSDDCESNPDVTCKIEEHGIYIVPAECNTCPCVSAVTFKSEIVRGDVFFPIIYVDYDERTHIFSKGNEVKINR